VSTGTVRRPAPSEIPDSPGCYLFRDEHGRVVYVGKALSLRSRVTSYFNDPRNLHPRTVAMLAAARDVEWIVTNSEVESLHLEYNLIKEHRPRYNVRYRDDKSYPSLAITWNEDYPRAMVMRGPRKKGVRYYGPYAHAYAIRETLDLLLRTFPIRTCSQGIFDRAKRINRPCLMYDIGKCAAPCVGHVSADEHRGIAGQLCDFLDGRTEPVVKRLEGEMRDAAGKLEFERAARLRDQLTSVRTAIEKQTAVTDSAASFDAIELAEDDLEAAVQVFFVRRGRVVGRKGFVVDKVEDLTSEQLLAGFVRDLYMDADVPPEILVPRVPADADVLGEWLGDRRGAKVSFHVPQRGEKRALLDTVAQNARESFVQHKLKRRKDFEARAKALRELQDALDLPEAPLRIECYDISNLGPTEKVGSMVVFEDGLPKRSDYRKFKIKGVEGQDDFASMAEVIRRRFEHHEDDPDKPKKRRFAYPPNLIVIDGGRGQLNAALDSLAKSGVQNVTAAGLAKRFEEVYLPERPEPLVVARGSEALYLLQHIRDEAHRFAITYHRSLRNKKASASALDAIPGVGPERKRLLLRKFGSVRRILQATEEELAEVVPANVAHRIHPYLRGLGEGVDR
jgi:excinuclease ABC subunit C